MYVLLLFRILKLVSCLLDERVTGIVAVARTLHLGSYSGRCALEVSVFFGLHCHIVILHNEVYGQLLPSLQHLLSLLVRVVVQVLQRSGFV